MDGLVICIRVNVEVTITGRQVRYSEWHVIYMFTHTNIYTGGGWIIGICLFMLLFLWYVRVRITVRVSMGCLALFYPAFPPCSYDKGKSNVHVQGYG